MTSNCVVGWIAIIGSIGSQLVDLIIDLIKQWFQLRGIACFQICQEIDNDLATVGINSQAQFLSAMLGLCAVLLVQPLAGRHRYSPGAVDQHMNGVIRHCCRSLLLARRLSVALSGTGKSSPIISSTELRGRSLWRSRIPNTMPNVT